MCYLMNVKTKMATTVLLPKLAFPFILILCLLPQMFSKEDGYLHYVKNGCFIKGEALSCVKYKALKLAKKTFFGNTQSNETIKANHMISFVPLDEETVKMFTDDNVVIGVSEPRGIFSEWAELTKYVLKLVKDFFRTKGLKVDLPDGSRMVEADGNEEEGRAKKKKLALIVPFLTLLAALKTKLLLLPILLSVLLIKKLLLAAALLIPSLLHTLKACKVHQPSFSYFGGSSDTSDFSTGYGNSLSYSSGGGYGKDWAANRAYTMPKPRPSPSSMYMTAPGGVA